MTYITDPDSALLFDPQHSVFVTANAGSGKTTLLVKRVVALLLHGVAPHKILCLTYTNAAAAEMATRVTDTLGKWVMMDDSELSKEITTLTHKPVNAEQLTFARSLFATVLDAPMGMQLQTIHGFSQSLLARFPIEAGVDTHLSIMDEHDAQRVMKEAIMQLLGQAAGHDGNLRAAMYYLVQKLGDYNVQELLSAIVANKQHFITLFNNAPATEWLAEKIYQALGVEKGADAESIIAAKLVPQPDQKKALLQACEILATSDGDSNKKCFAALSAWLPHYDAPNLDAFNTLCGYMTTQKGEPRKTLFKKKTLPPELEGAVMQEQARALDCMQVLYALANAEMTEQLLHVARALMTSYEQLKNEQGMADFDDQILKATALLTKSNMAAWVLYKLDGGIDHILVDEAQDTSPNQWSIIKALSDEFMAGTGSRDIARSLFIVGDEKQSIFRFQGADPTGFARARTYFSQRLEDSGLPYSNASLTRSFRSAPEILSLVDTVFGTPEAAKGLTSEADSIHHIAHRETAKGYAELWPLVPADKENHRSAHYQLAEQIAGQIEQWVRGHYYLEAKGRNVEPGDFMVLVRTRAGVMHPLARALKRRNIPVAGVDRVNLLDELVIQDLLAFADTLLLPEDDLTLAGLLKSPIFNMSEDALFALCHGRDKQTIWQRMSQDGSLREAYQLLSDFRAKVDFISPYALFSELLEVRGIRRSFTGRMGEEMNELLDEFLEQCLIYERSHAPSMQGFLSWMKASESDIKRDMEQAGSMVRIMTIHGAKGLQAPIVFVADTTGKPGVRDKIHWHGELPVLSSGASRDSNLLKQLKTDYLAEDMDEYRRLLYVALTRAEDVLVVCGAGESKNKYENSWYRLTEPAFKALGTPSGERIIYGTPLTKAHAPLAKAAAIKPSAFVPSKAPEEPIPAKPLSPSRLTSDAPAAYSPKTDGTQAEQGSVIHRIFQHVTSLPLDDRQKAAGHIVKTYGTNLPVETHDRLIAETLNVMQQPEYATLFSQDSLAEVPVSGLVKWKGQMLTVSGQIDRLWIGKKDLWIVDFKSHQSPPDSNNIPVHYVGQMALYKALVQSIYPSHTIHSGLLWTAIPRLDTIPSKLLDEVPASAYI